MPAGECGTARVPRWPVTVSAARVVELVAEGADGAGTDAELFRRAAEWIEANPHLEVVGVDLGRSWLPAHTFLRLFVADERSEHRADTHR